MPETLQKNYAIDVQQKVYEKETPAGMLAVYQTISFGMLLTLNGDIIFSETDGFFLNEMLAHPALFTHPRPHKVAILGNCFGTLQEVLKHSSVQEVHCVAANSHLDEAIAKYFPSLYQTKQNQRVKYLYADPQQWLAESQGFDLIINDQYPDSFAQEQYKQYFHALNTDGILVQTCKTSLLQLQNMKPLFENVYCAGFSDCKMLSFPQPSCPTGWRTAIMTLKSPTLRHPREKDVFNRNFPTRYYNFDTHKAALAVPEYIRGELDNLFNN